MHITGYVRIPQDGIEPLEDLSLEKDEKSGHYFFDHIRGFISHYWNEKDQVGGIAVFTFGPNGTIWSQEGENTGTLPWWAAFYQGVLKIFKEAQLSKSKHVTVYCDNKELVGKFKAMTPYKDETAKNIHSHIIEQAKSFNKFEVIFRNKFPVELDKRINEFSRKSSQILLFDNRGSCWNEPGKYYYNIGGTEEDTKAWAEQLANFFYDHMQNYLKEYEQDYGFEAKKQLVKDMNDGNIKEPPPLKRILESRSIKSKITKPNTDKRIDCYHCDGIMVFQRGSREKSKEEVTYEYTYRCPKCLALRILDKKNRTIKYGRYPKTVVKD